MTNKLYIKRVDPTLLFILLGQKNRGAFNDIERKHVKLSAL